MMMLLHSSRNTKLIWFWKSDSDERHPSHPLYVFQMPDCLPTLSRSVKMLHRAGPVCSKPEVIDMACKRHQWLKVAPEMNFFEKLAGVPYAPIHICIRCFREIE